MKNTGHSSLGLLAVVSSLLSSCISSSDQFKNTTHPNPAEIRTQKSSALSTAYGNGVRVTICDIDGKTTFGNFKAVSEPFLVSPGKHELAVSIVSIRSSSDGFHVHDFKAGQKYLIRGKQVGAIFVLEIVNTTSGEDKIESQIRTFGQQTPSPVFIPIVVSS
jgi:hypothetical protein